MRKNNFLIFLGGLFLLTLGCQTSSTYSAEKDFQSLLNELTASTINPTQGVSLSVYAPDVEISWTGNSGVSDVKKNTALVPSQPFRIASITKTFVAASIMLLHEKDSLSIDDPISQYISKNHLNILLKGGYDPDKILIKHCLNHTSGLFDYAVGSRTYINIALENPKKRWTRTEQLKGAMAWGKPVGAPGEKYHYSDTGYILLGEILEKMTQKNLGGALRMLLDYDNNELNTTYLQSLDDTVSTHLTEVRRYLNRRDLTEWDNSIDLYGGGGLVSTTKDMASFYYKLFNEEFFSKPETIDLMLTKSGLEKGKNLDYRYGFHVVSIFGKEVYMHGGFWNSYAIYLPEFNASIGINFTKEGNHKYIIKKLITLLTKHSQNK
ncbi:MAG: serine hydrolase domain-containing protein [Saprospiraceae bacterium]